MEDRIRAIYLLGGLVLGLLFLLGASLALFSGQADARPPDQPLALAQSAGATPSASPTAGPTACSYSVLQTTGKLAPGTYDIGNHCDDCITELALPFPVSFYGQQFSLANVSSNGNLQFNSANPISFNACLPEPSFEAAIMPHWDDLLTDDNPGCPGGQCGIFTALTGAPPDRTFTIEWRAGYFKVGGNANFEARLHEGTGVFDFVYGHMDDPGNNSTVGVQNEGAAAFAQYSCNGGGLSEGLMVTGSPRGCGIPTGTPTVA